MNLLTIPATAFPALQQIIINQTSSRNYSFASYLKLAELVQHVTGMRLLTFYLLSRQKSALDPSILIDNLQRQYKKKKLDHHGIVYGLYLLGAYQDASHLVECHFKNENPTLEKRIEQIKTQLLVNTAELRLKEILEACLMNNRYNVKFSTRIKSAGSLFAKLVIMHKFNFETLINLEPENLEVASMPYDLIGGSILVDKINEDEFTAFIKRTKEYFSKQNVPLIDQNVYCSKDIKRISLVGSMRIEKKRVPFQLHIWDKNAERYELLSYGNYKMNKIFYPVLPNWKDYLDGDLSPSKYMSLVISSFLQT